MILTVWKLEELRSTEASQTHQNSSLSFVSTYDFIDNDSVKKKKTDFRIWNPFILLHTFIRSPAIVFQIKINDWTISSQNVFVCSWLALLLLRCWFEYMISNLTSYRNFGAIRTARVLSEEEAKYIDPCCSSRSDCGDWSEMESLRGREESSFKVSLPTYTPSPSMCFRAHFSLYSPHYLNTRNWLKPVTRVAKDCDWLVPLWRVGGRLYAGYDNQVLSCKWSWDANIFRTITLWC